MRLLLSMTSLLLAGTANAFVPTTSQAFSVATNPTTRDNKQVIQSSSSFSFKSSPLKLAPVDVEPDLLTIHADADFIFRVIDEDGNSSITLEELMGHMGKSGYADAAVQKIFKALDTNKDGVISQDEFRSGLVKFAQLRTAPGLGEFNRGFVKEIHADSDSLFYSIDADGNGTISKDELKGHLARTSKYSDPAINKIFRMLDVNKDGEISKEELREAFVRYSALRQAIGEGPNYK
jgi:Ca2+-binding EF-hand superfamily protein